MPQGSRGTLPWENAWCEKQRAKCKSSDGRERRYARRLGEQSFMCWACSKEQGVGVLPTSFFPLPPQPLPRLLHVQSLSPQVTFNAPIHSFGTQMCVCLPSGVLKNQVGLPSWRQEGSYSGNFLFKEEQKPNGSAVRRDRLGLES